MKKSLLLVLFAFIYTLGNAQVVFYVQPPSPLEGSYSMTYADDWGNQDDLTDGANAVIAELVFAYDASDADSLVCDDPSTLVTDVDGKIAMIYRGVCNFSLKALSAQQGGAVACVIITYEGEEPVGMGAGDLGPDVTIPVVMITRDAAEALKPSVQAGGVEAFIGNKTGYYANDLAIRPSYVVRAPQATNVSMLAQDETEYELGVGTWVKNDGFNEQTGIELTVSVDMGGSNIYSETLALDEALATGDSVFMSTTDFSQSTYVNDSYALTYSVASDSIDHFEADNTLETVFDMTEHSYSFANLTDGEPNNVNYYRPGEIFGQVQQCVHFMDANASRLGATGLTISATTDSDDGIDGEVIDVFAYEWALEFDDLNDTVNYTGVNPDDFDLLTEGSYEFIGGDAEGASVYVAFEEAIELEDDTRYLFCLSFESDNLFTAFESEKLDYLTTQDVYLQPMYPNTAGEIDTDGNEVWFLNGYGTEITPSIVVNMIDVNAVGIEEESNIVDVTPYPNPAREFIHIPMNDISGLTTVQIFDVAGKLVATQDYNSTGNVLRVDVSTIEAGSYTFGLRYENGNVSNFNVVIAK